MDLNLIWFALIGVMFIAYAVLDGFDFGVGALHLFTKTDAERRVVLNSIGPVWDGNEVWMVAGIGALFGAFPLVYAGAFSGFYLAFIFLLIALMFRAVAIEFRSKEPWPAWRKTWDVMFTLGSITSPFIFGLMIGNIVMGVPVGPDHEFVNFSFTDLFRPYALLVAVFVISLFALHGAIYLNMKTEGELQARVKKWVIRCFVVFIVMYVVTTAATLIQYPHMIANFEHFWWAWIVVALNVLAIANVPRTMHKGLEYQAIFTSGCIIAGIFMLFGIGIFPTLLPSSLNPDWSLTIYNSGSSDSTLWTMLWIALIGMPFVVAYTVGIYWVFRGKTKVDKLGY
jgi:cytochrome d ubiquinol oxidase subunit II